MSIRSNYANELAPDSTTQGLPGPATTVTILFVSSLGDDHASIRRILAGSNWRLQSTSTCAQALAFLKYATVPVVICERELPDGDWKVLLEEMEKLTVAPRLIVSSRLADDRLWAEVLNLGGFDVLPTPLEGEEVIRVLHLAWLTFGRAVEQAMVAGRLQRSSARAASPHIRGALSPAEFL